MFLSTSESLIALVFLGMSAFSQANEQTIHHVDIKSQFTKQPLLILITLPTNFKENDDQPYVALYTTAGDRRLKSMVEQINWMSHVSFDDRLYFSIVIKHFTQLCNTPLKSVWSDYNIFRRTIYNLLLSNNISINLNQHL